MGIPTASRNEEPRYADTYGPPGASLPLFPLQGPPMTVFLTMR